MPCRYGVAVAGTRAVRHNRMRAALRDSEAHPQLEDSSAYRQLRPTRLDKIKNLHGAVQAGGIGTC